MEKTHGHFVLWHSSWMSSLSTLTGSGSGFLDGIPGSLDGLHKTSRNSHMKDLVVVDVVPALSSAVSAFERTFCSEKPALPDKQCVDPTL